MGDVCTGSPTLTSFSASTTQSVIVSQSTSQSISVGEASVVTRSFQSGTGWVLTESTIAGGTSTIQVEVPITITTDQVVQVPVATLFAPCSSSETPTSSSATRTSAAPTTPTSTEPEPTSTSQTRVRTTTDQTPESSAVNSNSQNAVTSFPTSTPQASLTQTDTGTLITTTSAGVTTLPNGSQSSFVATFTSSISPNGTLNDGNNSGGGQSSNNSRALAIGLGVAGGVLALIILVFGITWHIRRKRRNEFDGMGDNDIWAPGHEPKIPLAGSGNSSTHRYSYNPYGDSPIPARYTPVPTRSPTPSRPLSLADPMVGGYPPTPQPAGVGVTAPLLTRAKTADEILYEAARQDLPKSRTSSATASHHTRPSETGLIHRTNPSLSASHKTHGSTSGSHRTNASLSASHITHASESTKSRRSESVSGLLNPEAGARGSLVQDAQLAQRYQDLMNAPPDIDRPMSPVSVVAPRLAIANPDVDKD